MAPVATRCRQRGPGLWSQLYATQTRPMHLKKMLLAGMAMSLAPLAHADEGMWLPEQLPSIAGPLRAAGFVGDPAALADLTRAPLSAVVKVGGATGAFVSADGLVLTNHHVAFGVIQYNTNANRNLIEHGFVAADRAHELPANPDFRLRVTTGFDKVTEHVRAAARGKTGRAYFDAVEAATKALIAECERTADRHCSVANMFYGSDYYLVTQLELRDVRLVYAPPRAITATKWTTSCGRGTAATSPCCAPMSDRTASRRIMRQATSRTRRRRICGWRARAWPKVIS